MAQARCLCTGLPHASRETWSRLLSLLTVTITKSDNNSHNNKEHNECDSNSEKKKNNKDINHVACIVQLS